MNSTRPSLLTRRRVLGFGVASVLAIAVADCARGDPLRIGLQSWGGFQFLRLAERHGWLDDAPLRLVDFASSDEAAAALRHGRCQAATLTLDEVVRLRGAGVAVQVALICDVSAGADVLLAPPAIANMAALRGRRVGVESTALGALVFSEVLRASGLQRRDVVVVPIEEDHYLAWQRGGLDAVLTYGSSAERLRAEGLHPLIDSRDLRSVIYDVLAVRHGLDGRARRAIATLVDGHFRALELWQHNRIDTGYELSRLLDTPAEDVAELFNGVDLPDVTYNRHLLAPPAAELTATARDIASVLFAAGLLSSQPPLERLFTADYLPQAT